MHVTRDATKILEDAIKKIKNVNRHTRTYKYTCHSRLKS